MSSLPVGNPSTRKNHHYHHLCDFFLHPAAITSLVYSEPKSRGSDLKMTDHFPSSCQRLRTPVLQELASWLSLTHWGLKSDWPTLHSFTERVIETVIHSVNPFRVPAPDKAWHDCYGGWESPRCCFQPPEPSWILAIIFKPVALVFLLCLPSPRFCATKCYNEPSL